MKIWTQPDMEKERAECKAALSRIDEELSRMKAIGTYHYAYGLPEECEIYYAEEDESTEDAYGSLVIPTRNKKFLRELKELVTKLEDRILLIEKINFFNDLEKKLKKRQKKV